MRRFLYILISVLLMSASGCNRQETLRRGAWKPAGGEFDSLTEKIEWQFNEFVPFDSLSQTIARMESIADTESVNRSLRRSRTLYWKAKFMGRLQNPDSSILLIKQALSLNDSTAHEYDRLRMLSFYYTQCDTIDGGIQYRLLERALEYSRKSGDLAFEAYSSIALANLLDRIGEPGKAIGYLHRADSLNTLAGYGKLTVKNRINEARILGHLGKREASDSIMHSVMGHPALAGDTFAMNIIPRNLYVVTDSIKYLREAYGQIKDNVRYRELRGLYLALFANHNTRSGGNPDSMVYYADLAMKDLPHTKDLDIKAFIWLNAGLAQSLLGNADSALICRINYEVYLDSIHLKRQTSEVMRLSAFHEMKDMERRYAKVSIRRTMAWAFIVLLLVAMCVIVAMVLNRRHMRARMLAMRKELELEKTLRKITATTLSIQEKDSLLDMMKQELQKMRGTDGIKEQDARHLESAIRIHLLEHDNEETFREMFDTVNPDFTRRLRERCPGIADSYVNLASYILMQLDNKKIARLMNIRLESVHQSRWRLRQRLNLAEGETLDDALRALNTPGYLGK